ncbi:MAG: hypothetical protein K2W99_03205 [Chthoniobacterales bacterium]|nr:hypothetical protein [Chthoniobacterales bacterium]
MLPEQIILVTKPNTSRRAYATFAVRWPEMVAKLVVSAPLIKFNNLAKGQLIEHLVNELVGDIDRIIFYPEKGFQIEQEIPSCVMEAYLRLKKAGYSDHAIIIKS